MTPNAISWTIQMLEGTVETLLDLLKLQPDLTDSHKQRLYKVTQDLGRAVVQVKDAQK